MGATYTKISTLSTGDGVLIDQSNNEYARIEDENAANILKTAVTTDISGLKLTMADLSGNINDLTEMNAYVQGLADHTRGSLTKNTARNQRMVMFHRNQAFRMGVYTQLITAAIAVMIGFGGLFYMRRLDVISDTIASVVVAVVLFVMGVYSYMKLTDLRQRYNMDHDKIDFAIPAHMLPGADSKSEDEGFAGRVVSAPPVANWVGACASRMGR
jgi:hypothetical protein